MHGADAVIFALPAPVKVATVIAVAVVAVVAWQELRIHRLKAAVEAERGRTIVARAELAGVTADLQAAGVTNGAMARQLEEQGRAIRAMAAEAERQALLAEERVERARVARPAPAVGAGPAVMQSWFDAALSRALPDSGALRLSGGGATGARGDPRARAGGRGAGVRACARASLAARSAGVPGAAVGGAVGTGRVIGAHP